MKINDIINPVGLDLVIQDLQIYLRNNLSEVELIFGKAFKNETKSGKFIPEVYVSKSEYYEVFSDDRLKSFIFFDIEQTRNAENEGNTKTYKLNTIVRLIASANLQKIYPDLVHRANENFIYNIEQALKKYSSKSANWNLKRILDGSQNIFSNYNYEISDKYINMQPYYIVAFEFNVNYYNTNC